MGTQYDILSSGPKSQSTPLAVDIKLRLSVVRGKYAAEQGGNKVWGRERGENVWARRTERRGWRQNLINGPRSLWPWPLMQCYVSQSFARSCKLPPFPCSLPPLSLSLYPFLFITVGSPLPRPLSVFLPHFLMLWSMARWVLFIYGHALSVCVGLSNIHLSCAAIIQSLIPSHMRGMKHEHWSLLRSPSLNTPGSKWRESVCRGEELCRARCALLNTTKRTNRSTPLFFLFFFLLTSFFSSSFFFFFHRLFSLRSCLLLFSFFL